MLPNEVRAFRIGNGRKKISSMVVWFVSFWTLAYVSVFWSSSPENTLATNYITNSIQAFFLILLISYRIEDRRDLHRLITMLVVAALYGVIVLLAKTPSSAWGEERVGSAIGLNENVVGMNMAYSMMFALFLARSKRNWLYYLLAIVFVAVALFTGSKKALFLCMAGLLLLLSFSYKGVKGAVFAGIGIALSVLLYWLVMNVPDLYFVIGKRLEFMFGTTKDTSTLQREWFVQYAQGMFLQKPILGFGFNGFLTEMQRIGYTVKAYCHCNQWELLSCLGLVGFCLYYSLFIAIGKRFFRIIRSRGEDALFGIVVLGLSFAADYGYVSFVSPDIYVYLVLLHSLANVAARESSCVSARKSISEPNGSLRRTRTQKC